MFRLMRASEHESVHTLLAATNVLHGHGEHWGYILRMSYSFIFAYNTEHGSTCVTYEDFRSCCCSDIGYSCTFGNPFLATSVAQWANGSAHNVSSSQRYWLRVRIPSM